MENNSIVTIHCEVPFDFAELLEFSFLPDFRITWFSQFHVQTILANCCSIESAKVAC